MLQVPVGRGSGDGSGSSIRGGEEETSTTGRRSLESIRSNQTTASKAGGGGGRGRSAVSLNSKAGKRDESPPHEQVDFDTSKVVRTNVGTLDGLDAECVYVPESARIRNSRSLRTSLAYIGSQIKSDISSPLSRIRSRGRDGEQGGGGDEESSQRSGMDNASAGRRGSVILHRESSESERSTDTVNRITSHVGISRLHQKAHKLVESLAMNDSRVMYYGHRRNHDEIKISNNVAGLAGDSILTPDLEEHILQLSLMDNISDRGGRRRRRTDAGIRMNFCENDEDHDPEKLKKLCETYGVDALIEHQRGWFLLGYPFFSDKSLFPLDPYNWTNKNGQGLTGGIAEYSLPDFTWEWLWKRWYVDMSGDVDDQGWRYSWRFGSRRWHGNHIWFRSFVRKRTWKRIRRKVDSLIPEEEEAGGSRAPVGVDVVGVDGRVHTGGRVNSAAPAEILIGNVMFDNRNNNHNAPITPIISLSIDPLGTDSDEYVHHGSPEMPTIHETESKLDELVHSMKDSRIDRERIQKLLSFISDPDNTSYFEELERKLHEILELFEYRDSRSQLVKRLEMNIGEAGTKASSTAGTTTTLLTPSKITMPDHIQATKKVVSSIKDDIKNSPYFSIRRLSENPISIKGKGRVGTGGSISSVLSSKAVGKPAIVVAHSTPRTTPPRIATPPRTTPTHTTPARTTPTHSTTPRNTPTPTPPTPTPPPHTTSSHTTSSLTTPRIATPTPPPRIVTPPRTTPTDITRTDTTSPRTTPRIATPTPPPRILTPPRTTPTDIRLTDTTSPRTTPRIATPTPPPPTPPPPPPPPPT